MATGHLPDFIIIGAAKAGTTTLYARLSEHPQIFMSTPKEPEFFARDDRYAEGLDRYAALFAGRGPGQISGEASTLYSLAPYFSETARRMHEAIPDAKLIYVLRDPVDRAYSYFVQMTKNYQRATGDLAWHRSFETFIGVDPGREAVPREKVFAPFDHHLPDDPELCLAGSDYVLQIECYLEHYPRKRMLFLDFEDLRTEEDALLDRICDFLEIPALAGGSGARPPKNVAAAFFEDRIRNRNLDRLRSQMGMLYGLRRTLPEHWRAALRERATARLGTAVAEITPPPMRPETRRALEARYALMMPRLREITGLPLTRWSI